MNIPAAGQHQCIHTLCEKRGIPIARIMHRRAAQSRQRPRIQFALRSLSAFRAGDASG